MKTKPDTPLSMQYLADTVIKIPEWISHKYNEYDSARVGFDVGEQSVYLILVPRRGSGIHKVVASRHIPTKYHTTLLAEAMAIANSEREISDLLGGYYGTMRQE